MSNIKINHLFFKYSAAWLIKDFSLEIGSGKWVGLVGPNGSGKTSLLKIMAGILKPQKGQVLINGINLHGLWSFLIRKKIGIANQIFSIPPADKMEIILNLNRSNRQKAEELIKLFKLGHLKRRKAGKMSGRELQKLMIIKALLKNPDILLMDEPVNHLDIHQQKMVLDILKKKYCTNMAVVVVFHNEQQARKYCEKVVVLE